MEAELEQVPAIRAVSPHSRIQVFPYPIYGLARFTSQALGKYSIVLTIKADFFLNKFLQCMCLSIKHQKPNFMAIC